MRRLVLLALSALLTSPLLFAGAGNATPSPEVCAAVRPDQPPLLGCPTTSVVLITRPTGPTTTVLVDCDRLPPGAPPVLPGGCLPTTTSATTAPHPVPPASIRGWVVHPDGTVTGDAPR